jgi:hypothetical protein
MPGLYRLEGDHAKDIKSFSAFFHPQFARFRLTPQDATAHERAIKASRENALAIGSRSPALIRRVGAKQKMNRVAGWRRVAAFSHYRPHARA